MTWHMRTMGGVSVRQTGGIGMPRRVLDCVGFLFFFSGWQRCHETHVELNSDVFLVGVSSMGR